MPFVTAGYPDIETTGAILSGLDPSWADIIELGIPFSDPIADGPIIAASMHEALQAGVRPGHVFELVRSIRADIPQGLVAMVSTSIVERSGAVGFIEEAARAGFDGLIIPDVDLDRVDEILPTIDAHEMAFSLLVAPSTTDARLESILPRCRGFIYMLARAGLTGIRSELPDISPQVERIRRLTDLPIAVGFGISSAEHVSTVLAHADAAIVGSAIVRSMGTSDDPAAAALDTIRALSSGRPPTA
jgi:tryptophan synthase alpha chain